MLFSLKDFMKLCGVFRFDNLHYLPSTVLQIMTNMFVVLSMGFFIVNSVIFSFKHQNIFDIVKSAGYSYLNMTITGVTYIYLLLTRAKLWCLTEAWEATIQNS